MFPVHKVGQNHLARHSERGEKTRQTEEEVGRQNLGLDRPGVHPQRKKWEDKIWDWTGLGFTKSRRRRKNGVNWLQNHLWCPNDPHG